MLSPSIVSKESERFVIVGSIKKVGFLQGFTGGEWQKRVCALNEVLKVVSATVYGFLR